MATLERSERFKDARILHNINGKQTMDEVAAATGVSKSVIWSLENDEKKNVGYLNVAALAKHYGVSADWLMCLRNERTADMTIQTICEYTGISETAIEQIISFRDDRKIDILNSILTDEQFEYILRVLTNGKEEWDTNPFLYRPDDTSEANTTKINQYLAFERKARSQGIYLMSITQRLEYKMDKCANAFYDIMRKIVFGGKEPSDEDELFQSLILKYEDGEDNGEHQKD